MLVFISLLALIMAVTASDSSAGNIFFWGHMAIIVREKRKSRYVAPGASGTILNGSGEVCFAG